MNMVMGMMMWRPHLAAVASGLLVGLLVVWGFIIYRNLLSRMPRRRALLLLLPRALVALLLVVALLDPVWSRSRAVSTTDKILTVVDASSSMEVRDSGRQSRAERARALIQKIKAGLPSGMQVKPLEFDTELRDARASAPPAGVRNTDVGAVLLSLSKRSDLSSCAAVVLLTDGGDEPVENVELPPLPLYVVGVGSDLSKASDLALADVRFPASIEKDANFEIQVDLMARTPSTFAREAVSRVPLTLEREEDGQWRKEEERIVDLSKGWLQTAFKTTGRTPGLLRFRLSLGSLPGELSVLNNSRTVTLDVRKKSLHVLFFARELGLELKLLRSELLRDPGVTFTALFRTIGERFTVQGERVPGDESLESGFPTDAQVLKPFDCVIIGSVPVREWRDSQIAALKAYVENGGAVIFLADESLSTPTDSGLASLAPLVPWEPVGTGRELLRGGFAVSIPAAVANHPIVAGIGDLLQRANAATVETVFPVGRLKAGSTALMTAAVDKRAVPLVAVQRYGKGTVLALASNTLWKWARQSDEQQKAYGLFWRQAVRNLASNAEGGQILSVKWDKEFYRPGEKAVAEIRTTVSGDASELQLIASLARDREVRQIPVEPLQGQVGTYGVRLVFEQRGTYRFQLAAHQGNSTLETYDKVIPVAPRLSEGARLELDAGNLARLAKLGNGMYVEEEEIDKLIRELTAMRLTRTVSSDVSVLSGAPWFALVFLLVLMTEWIIRRRMNLF